MKWVLMLFILSAAPAFANDTAIQKLEACFTNVDAAFQKAGSKDIEKRLAALPTYATFESQCLSDVLSGCAFGVNTGGCVEGLVPYLDNRMRSLHATFPDKLVAPAGVQTRYLEWLAQVRDGKAVQRSGCNLTDRFPPDSCEILALGAALIDARSWQRTLKEIERAN